MQITSREREISNILRQEPLISQDELAVRLGITRSSVAVHISNLIKKGIIIGKGYVFNQQAVCTVVGSAAYLTLVQADEPVSIERVPDGLAVKGCQALQNFDLSVKVVTVLGTDSEGDELLAIMARSADVSGVDRQLANKSQQWVRINRKTMVETIGNITTKELLNRLALTRQPWLDCNFLWIEPGYLADVLPMIKENDIKAPFIVCCSNASFEGDNEVDILIIGEKNSPEPQPSSTSKTLVVTDGCHYVTAQQGQETIQINILPGQQFNVETELERFTAGFIYGLSRGSQLRQAIRMAIGNTSYQVNHQLKNRVEV